MIEIRIESYWTLFFAGLVVQLAMSLGRDLFNNIKAKSDKKVSPKPPGHGGHGKGES